MFKVFLFLFFGGQILGQTCESPECQLLSKRFLENMKDSVDPCDDFYEFACGNYARIHPIADNQERITAYSEVEQDLDRNLLRILKTPRDNSTVAMKLARTYFDSCMDSESEKSIEPLLDLVSRLGGWGLLENSAQDSRNWEELAGQISNHGIHPVISPFVHNSFKDSKKHDLMLEASQLFFTSESFYRNNISDNKNLQYYQEYMTSLLRLLGANLGVQNGVKDVIEFERSLAKISAPMGSRSHSEYDNLMTYGELKSKYKGINWDAYFNMGMADSMKINVIEPGFYEKLGKLVKSTSEVTVKNYLMWRLVQSYNVYLPDRYQEPLDVFNEKRNDVKKQPTWQRCVAEVCDKLSMPLATEFLHKYFTEHDKSVAEEMVKDLKEAMGEELKMMDWIDEPTKRAALKKLELMETRIGYPDYLLNETAVLLPFTGVHLNPSQYFKNAVLLRKAAQREQFTKLHRVPEVNWPFFVLKVNAAAYFFMNEMLFPAGILQFPMFVPNAPAFANYGAIGTVMGHEITHGYDNSGAQYDEHGNLRNWWGEQTRLEFENRTLCFIDQYSQQIEPTTSRKINGKLTIGENIADNGGVRIAYQAYLKKLSREKSSTKLLGFEKYTSEQMFFIAQANLRCSSTKLSAMNAQIDGDVHSASNSRVNVPLQNFAEFAEKFQCAKGTRMNPEEKCRIW